ncbi:hypothetical protein IY73_03745 [Lawsonella clevelandensis]|nr:hypothetical protein IY73_03745 [Lawsonella clevelandensis]
MSSGESSQLETCPGEVLKEEFLDPMGISQYRLAKEVGVSESRISKVVRGEARITADLALRLGKFFSMDPVVWIRLQSLYDLRTARRKTDLSDVGVWAAA